MPIILCGIPASGKSTYGRWLQQEKGMLFIDVEEGDALEQAGLKEAWMHLIEDPMSASDFVLLLGKSNVLAWGFPSEYLPVVGALQHAGMSIWWLDGDRNAARESFIGRGTVPLECFETRCRTSKHNGLALKTCLEIELYFL